MTFRQPDRTTALSPTRKTVSGAMDQISVRARFNPGTARSRLVIDQRVTYPLSFLRGPQNQPPTRPPGSLTRKPPTPGRRVSVNPSAKSSKTSCKAGYAGSESVRTSETNTNSRAATTVFAGLSNACDRTGRYLRLTIAGNIG